jgi:hypothetical protein
VSPNTLHNITFQVPPTKLLQPGYPPTALHSVTSWVPPKNYSVTSQLPPAKLHSVTFCVSPIELVSCPRYLLKNYTVSQPRYHISNYTVTSQVPPTKLHSVTSQVPHIKMHSHISAYQTMQHHISEDCVLNQRKYLAVIFETVGKILVGNTVVWTPEEFLICWTIHFWQSKKENKVEGIMCVCVFGFVYMRVHVRVLIFITSCKNTEL